MLISSLTLCLLAMQAGAASSTPPKPGSVSGQVASLTGEPIRKAQVTLRRVDAKEPQAYTTVSDSGGGFSFGYLAPGRYVLAAEKSGFVQSELGTSPANRGGSAIAVAAGQDVTGMVLKLAPQAVIAGKVVDEDGDPVAYAQIMVLKQRYMRGKRQWMPGGGGQVNDLGEFRVAGLQAGRYLVAASAPRYGTVARGVNANKIEESLVTTYYPGVVDIARATPIEVAAGAEERSIDLRMLKARTYRVSGKVTGNPGERGVTVMLNAGGSEALSLMGNNLASTRNPDGTFEFSGVLPGTYTLIADRRTGSGEQRFGARLELTVGDQNVDGLNVQLLPGAELPGVVRIDGAAKSSPEHIQIGLQGLTGVTGARLGAQVKPDGKFAIDSVLPDRYRVTVYPQTEFYVSSIRYGNQELKDGVLDLAGGAAGALEVFLGADGAVLNGVVQDSKQRPAAGVTVVLAPEGVRRANPDLFRNTISDQKGAFRFQAIPPGDYTVIAWEEVEDYAWTDLIFLTRFDSEGKSVSLKSSASDSLNISFIAPENGSRIEREADEREKNNNR